MRRTTDSPGVETRLDEGRTDRLRIYVDGQEIGHLERARVGWVGRALDGREVRGRTANATANRVLAAAHAPK